MSALAPRVVGGAEYLFQELGHVLLRADALQHAQDGLAGEREQQMPADVSEPIQAEERERERRMEE